MGVIKPTYIWTFEAKTDEEQTAKILGNIIRALMDTGLRIDFKTEIRSQQ